MNVEYKTYSNIVSDLLATASSITNVSEYSEEDYFNFNAKTNILYPYILVYGSDIIFNIKSGLKDYVFSILIFDRLLEDKSNYTTLKNDMSEIMNEYLTLLNANSKLYNITFTADENASFFEEKFDDLVAGYIINIRVKVNNKLTVCRIAQK
jgi:hypothetical protein